MLLLTGETLVPNIGRFTLFITTVKIRRTLYSCVAQIVCPVQRLYTCALKVDPTPKEVHMDSRLEQEMFIQSFLVVCL